MSNAGRICPQCGYERQARDLAPDYECPRCGIIYSKYVPPKPPAPVAENGVGEKRPPVKDGAAAALPFGVETAQGLVPASLARRAWAGIYTGAKASYFLMLMLVPLYYGFRFFCLVSGIDFRFHFETMRTIFGLLAVGLAFNAYLLHPIRHSETWGQKEFGLTVRPADNPRGDLSGNQWLLRCLGNAIASLCYPITSAVFLYGLYSGKNFPSLADRLSGTRQYETGTPAIPGFRYALNWALKPSAIAVLIGFFVIAFPSLLMQIYAESLKHRRVEKVERVVSPEEAKKQKAFRDELKDHLGQKMAAAADQNTFKILSELERRHYADQGGYTDDLEALVSRYTTANSHNGTILMSLIRDGSVRARKTEEGVEIWVLTASGDWQSRELRR